MPAQDRVVFLLADGARPDVVEELMRSGQLPNLQRLYAPQREPVRRAATTLPSATGPGYLPFLTGRFAGPLNIPGIRWFDRFAYTNKKRFQSKRSYVGLGHRYLERDLGPGPRTLFHLEPDHVNVYNPVRLGVRPERDRLQTARALLAPVSKYFRGWQLLDRSVQRATRDAVKSGARLVFSTFMGVDENSHDHGVRHAKTLEAYRLFDESVGEVVHALEARHELDRSRIVVASDHGLSDTHHHFALAEHVEEHGYKTLYYPRIWRHRPRAVVMVSGNALAHLYLPKRGNWAYRPRGASLWAEHGDLLQSLSTHASVAFIAYRDDDGSIVVHKGEDRTRFRRSDGQVKIETVGRDPLGLPPGLRAMDESYYFQLSWDAEYPDAVVQLTQLFESPRSGDVLVLSRPGHDLRARFEVPEHKASHGSLHRDHLLVPLLINDPALATAPCRTVDAFVYLARFLGHALPPEVDGRDLPRVEPVTVPVTEEPLLPVLERPAPSAVAPAGGPAR